MAVNVTLVQHDGTVVTVTIPSNQSLSNPVQIRSLSRVLVPSTWAVAPVTFQVSVDGSAWYDLLNAAGSEVQTATLSPNSAIQLDPADFPFSTWIKIRSGTRTAPVNQP